MTTEIDTYLQQRVIALAEAYPKKWEEVIDGRTDARSWFIGMTQFGLDEQIERKVLQAYIDGQVDTIRQLDEADAKGLKAWKHSRLPALTRACGVPENKPPFEDVLAKAVVEGAEAEVSEWTMFGADGDCAQGNHDDPNAPPRMEISISDIQPDGTRRVTSWHAVEVVSHDQQQDPDFVAIDIKVPTKEEAQAYFASIPSFPPPPREIICGLDGSITIVARHGVRLDVPEIPTGDEAAEIAEQINDVFGGYFTRSDLSEGEVSKMLDAIDLSPGAIIQLPDSSSQVDLTLLPRLLETEDGDHADDRHEIYNRIIQTPIYRNDPLYRMAVKTFAYRIGLKPSEPGQPGDVSKPIDAVGLKPGTPFDLPEGYVLHVKPGDFKPIPGENPEIDYDQLGGWLFEMIIAAGVCTYDEAKPKRPFHLYEVLEPATDNGTYAEAEHVIAKAIDRGLEKFKDRTKLPELDVQAYRQALAFEPD